MKKVSCSIVIPSLGSNLESIQKSIQSILNCRDQQSISVSIKVVLNGQNNQELRRLILEFSTEANIELLIMGKNLGFSAATNAGIMASEADYIVTLNDDAWVEPDFLIDMINSQQQTGADMVASTIYRLNTSEIDSCGFDFAWRGKAVAIKPADQYIEKEAKVEKKGSAVANHVQNDILQLTSALEKDPDNWRQNLDLLPKIDKKQQELILNHHLPFGPDAAAALYTRNLLDRVGLFNESYFAYLEDVDLALRARLAGFNCAWACTAIVHHEKHATSDKMGKFKQKQDVKNWWRIVMGSYPRRAWGRYGGQILLERARNLKGLIFSD